MQQLEAKRVHFPRGHGCYVLSDLPKDPHPSLHSVVLPAYVTKSVPGLLISTSTSNRRSVHSSRSGAKVRIWYSVKTVLRHIDYWTNRADVEFKHHVVIKVQQGQIIHHH